MNIADKIVLLAVKGLVIAFHKETGARLWEHQLGGSALSGDFVTVMADSNRVYAHTYGEMFCLDLATGNQLWRDKLSGLGYSLASIALPDATSNLASVATRIQREREANNTSASTN